MRVLLDGHPVNIPRPTLAAALAAVAEAAESRGRLVGEVTADGSVLDDDQIEGATDQPSSIRELVCISLDPIDLVASTLRESVAALETTARDQQTAAEQIQAGKTQEALATLGPVLATWQVVQMVVDRGGTAVNIDFSTASVPGIDEPRPVERCGGALMKSLLELKKALAQED